MIMKWKRSELLIVSITSLTLLAFAGILLELFLAKNIKGEPGNKFHKAQHINENISPAEGPVPMSRKTIA